MNTKNKFEEKVLKEIREVQPKNRAKLIEIIHYLRVGITVNESAQVKNTKRFAGMWQDLSEAELDELLSSYKNRETYFEERRLQ